MAGGYRETPRPDTQRNLTADLVCGRCLRKYFLPGTQILRSASVLTPFVPRSPGYAPPMARGDLMKREAVWGRAPATKVDRDASEA